MDDSQKGSDKQKTKLEVKLIEEVDFDRNLDQFEDRHLFQDLSEENKNIHLNKNLHGLSKSATLEINEKSQYLAREGMKIYKFGLGQSPFPVPEIGVKALKENAYQKDYLPVKGLYELRIKVADYHQRKLGIKLHFRQVMIGPGSKELLFLLQMCFKGTLLLPSPAWVTYLPQAIITENKVRILHTSFETKWRITANQLRTLCEEDKINKLNTTRILLLNYPGNPEGNTYTSSELKEIASVARRYNILILSDEIYGELNYEGNHSSIAQFYPEGTIISAGISKWAGAGGWRLGTFVFPNKLKWLQDAMAVVASESFTSVSAPIQWAAVSLYSENSALEKYLENCRRILEFIGLWCANTLRKAKIKVHDPKGAFYLFIDFEYHRIRLNEQGLTNSKEVVDTILETTGVAILPGVDFARPIEELTARLAFVNFDGQKALESINNRYKNKELDFEFLNLYCKETVEGIMKLTDWFNSLYT